MPRLRKEYLTILIALLPGCYCNNMTRQPKYKPEDPSSFFVDGRSARPVVPDSVAFGRSALKPDDAFLKDNELLYTGKVNGQLANAFPIAITRPLLERGRQRYNIFCAVCHGRLGDGNGMIAQRGFLHPPSYHDQRLRDAPAGHFFDVITNGFGAMYSYADRIGVEDRWAIVAYVRALQLSQHASPQDVPSDELRKLDAGVEATSPSLGRTARGGAAASTGGAR